MKAIERDFPFEYLDPLAEQESWRKEVNRPIYHIHKWWANRLGSVFRTILLGAAQGDEFTWNEFYKKHDLNQFVVLDPFMGSGTTVGEALKLGMRAVGCDINPISTFQVRQALTQVDELQLSLAFKQLEAEVAPKIRDYYRTIDPTTGECLTALYYFWVKTVTTPDGEVIPLFSNYVFSRNAYASKKPEARILCKHCGEIIHDRFDAQEVTCKCCGVAFNPQVGPANRATVTDSKGTAHKIKDLVRASGKLPEHLHYATMALDKSGNKVYLRATDFDRELYRLASERLHQEALPLPVMEIRPGHNTNQARGYNYLYWRECFNDRQLLCLGMLLQGIGEIKDRDIREQLLCLFSSTLEFNNLFCSFKGEGTGAVRHMFSHHILKPERQPLENSIWGNEKSSGTFSTLFKSRLLRAKSYLNEPFEIQLHGNTSKIVCSAPLVNGIVDNYEDFVSKRGAALVLNGDSSNLPLPDGSVDAVVTDPPYFDFVHYSELSDFFYSWLSVNLASEYCYFQKPNSSDEGEVQNKLPEEFAQKLGRVLIESNRCLKDDGLLIFSFHHSRPEAWEAIYSALRQAGFWIVASHPIKAEMSVGSPKAVANDPINIDAILVCKKHQPKASFSECVLNAEAMTMSLVNRLESAGRALSASDKRVVLASQVLVSASALGLEASCVGELLRQVFTSKKKTKSKESPGGPVDQVLRQ